MNRLLISATILSLGLWTAGCKNDNKDTEAGGHHKMAEQNMQTATATIEPTKGNSAKGMVTFTQMGEKVRVVADISGLTPNGKHGFHIHEGTECGDDGMKAGGHYNPEKHDHGLPNAATDKRHAGDFGNLSADGSGKAHLELTVDNISISGAKNPIVGHALIVHGKPDDGSQPTGNAGPRIGCGIIKAGGKVASYYHTASPTGDYVVGRYDLVSVDVVIANEKPIHGAARVSETGLLGLPQLPSFIQADGIPEGQLSAAIKKAYRDVYPDATVRVGLVEVRGNLADAKK